MVWGCRAPPQMPFSHTPASVWRVLTLGALCSLFATNRLPKVSQHSYFLESFRIFFIVWFRAVFSMCFWVSFLAHFFCDLLAPFWFSLGSLGAPNGRNIGDILGYPKVSQTCGIWEPFWSILGGFWVHFGRILET